MIKGKDIRKILCFLLESRVLIITGTDDEARVIRHEISDFVLGYISSELNVRVHSEGVNVGALDPILVYSFSKWNSVKRAYPFRGVLIVTDKNISGIDNIAVDTKKYFLTLEVKK